MIPLDAAFGTSRWVRASPQDALPSSSRNNGHSGAAATAGAASELDVWRCLDIAANMSLRDEHAASAQSGLLAGEGGAIPAAEVIGGRTLRRRLSTCHVLH